MNNDDSQKAHSNFLRINKELNGLSIMEKLEYWFAINDTDLYKPSEAEKYFGTNDLYRSELGYIPKIIFINHFGEHLNNVPEYVIYMAERSAYQNFLDEKLKIEENIKINGESYLKELMHQCLVKGNVNITELEIITGLKGKDELTEKYFYQKNLQPFIEGLRNNFGTEETQKIYKRITKKSIKTLNPNIQLYDIMIKMSYWTYIREYFAQQDDIDKNTGFVKENKRGNIQYFIALVKHLHSKGFYLDNKKPSNQEIVIILKNTFGLTTTLNTCKQTKAGDFDFKKIKYASEL